jgi:tRNA-specific 2-thiouridylase
MINRKKVFVGMSGGVDSSLSAALLVEQGYDVTGVYMKNWSQDLPGMKCPWADDLADAKRVAVQLGIDFKVFDFETQYKDKVVDYMIEEYKHGRTPNPDIMCNQEVKFKLFLDTALANGADMIAMGHYARVEHVTTNEKLQPKKSKAISSNDYGILKKAVDTNKDQTYFLYRVTGEALSRTLFPIGEYIKPKVRQMASDRGLVTASKRDSQGICFIGQVSIRDFLAQYVTTKPGNIIDKNTGKVLGLHDGAIYYTLGQRHGLDVGGGLPYYVVGKDMTKNEVYVTTNLNDQQLWLNTITLSDVHWINQLPVEGQYQIRVRHRAVLNSAQLKFDGQNVVLSIENSERAVTPGQSVVIYDGDICLGGGIVI